MSRMNIDNFMRAFQGGGARPNRFFVQTVFPNIQFVNDGSPIIATQEMRFMCKAASVPGSTMGNVDVPYMGRQFKVPGDRTFAEYSITVLNDVDFAIRRAFEGWMANINTHVSNVHNKKGGSLNMSDLMADIDIYQLGRDDSILAHYKIVGAYPTDIAAIDLAWDANDSVEEFTVTLSYQYWESMATKLVANEESATFLDLRSAVIAAL